MTLNDLERCNDRRRALSLSLLKFVARVCSVLSEVRLMFRMLPHSTACRVFSVVTSLFRMNQLYVGYCIFRLGRWQEASFRVMPSPSALRLPC